MTSKETEDENKAVKEIERLAKEQAKKEAEETKKAREIGAKSKKETGAAEKKAKKEAERLAKEQAKQDKKAKKEAVGDISLATAGGNFQLVLPSSVGFKQLKQFTDQLAGIRDLKIVWTGGSTDEGILIAVSVTQAMPLAQTLSEMPMVEGVEVKGDKINVTLKVSA